MSSRPCAILSPRSIFYHKKNVYEIAFICSIFKEKTDLEFAEFFNGMSSNRWNILKKMTCPGVVGATGTQQSCRGKNLGNSVEARG
jgi:hypothetical protein